MNLIQFFKNSFLGLNNYDKEQFYKDQFLYYRGFNTSIVVIAVLSSLSYFVSDCQLYGYFETETIIPRFIILVPLLLFLIYKQFIDNWKLEMILSHIVGHMIMWCTIWAIHFLPNRQYASDGFLILQLVILMLGFAATFEVSTVSQLLVIANILISNTFIHYEDIDLMISLGLPLAIGIACSHFVFTQSYYETYKTKKKLENLSFIDQLTDVYNRHKIDEITKDEKFINESLLPISIAIIDIDFFKKINDTYGHDNGDTVLKELASIIKATKKESDVAIRWGGEEFVIIMYRCNESQGKKQVEKIRKQVEQFNSSVHNITVSIGVSEYNGVSYKESIVMADKALYKAKELGRNQVMSFSEIK